MAEAAPETAVHPTAVVYPGAELGAGVEVGPYAVVESGAVVGDGVRLSAHVHLQGRVEIGENTVLGSGSVLGGPPQDSNYQGERTLVRIGAGCHLHENVTVNRATGEGNETVVGPGCRFMANAHVGHNVQVGREVILVNGAALGGYAEVGEKCFFSAASAMHQFTRVGRLTLIGGACMVIQDAPPFSIVVGQYPMRWRAMNTVGVRRAGFSDAERSSVRRALREVFASGRSQAEAARELLAGDPLPQVAELATFVLESKRGVCAGSKRSSGGAARTEDA